MTAEDERFARMLHLASKTTPVNEAFTPPIVNTTMYALPGDPSGAYQYARWGNPTWSALESALSALEEAETITFPSGMAAIASLFASVLKPGDRVLLPSDGYYTTRICADKYLTPIGIHVDTCATAQLDTHRLSGYRLVLIETPSNPALDLADIRAAVERAHAVGALVAVDNTTMTPLGQRPLDLGADLVVGADTKALNGHSDVLFGHVSSRSEELITGVRDWRRIVGAIPGPFEAWLVYRGLETLEVRLARMCKNALVLAQRFAEHRNVIEVRYPGLPSHPAHALAKLQMTKFGALIGVTLADKDAAERFINSCAFIRPATSFGGVHTSAERRARWGDQVADGFIRLSVGCEPTEALWTEINRALDASA